MKLENVCSPYPWSRANGYSSAPVGFSHIFLRHEHLLRARCRRTPLSPSMVALLKNFNPTAFWFRFPFHNLEGPPSFFLSGIQLPSLRHEPPNWVVLAHWHNLLYKAHLLVLSFVFSQSSPYSSLSIQLQLCIVKRHVPLKKAVSKWVLPLSHGWGISACGLRRSCVATIQCPMDLS